MFYIMTTNYLDSDIISNATASSEQSPFPAENIYNAQRRSKVWRSDGNWVIDATNNRLKFQETDGVDLQAFLTDGTYTSTTSFLAMLKTQMEAATGAASTYTIAQDTSTFKIKFTSNLAGGGNIFKLRWSQNTTIAGNLGFGTADDSGQSTYTADLLRLNMGEWLKWDMGLSTNPKAFILAGDRNRPLQLSQSGTYKLMGNETDIFTGPTYEKSLTYNGRAIVEIDTTGFHSEALRYWYLDIDDKDSPIGWNEIGVAFLGDFFNPTRGRPTFPFQANPEDRSPTVFSSGGQTFSDELEKTENFNVEWQFLTTSEKEELDEHFDNYGTSKPFFVVMDSSSAYSSSANYYTRYVKFARDPSYVLVSPDNYTYRMELREEL